MNPKDPSDALDGVSTREDIADYVLLLKTYLRERPEEWANLTLEMYLEAMMAVLAANEPDTFQPIHGPRAGQPTWFNLANLLLAGSAYE